MMNVLMYLFETHVYEESELVVDSSVLEDELLKVGFQSSEIAKALDWLQALIDLQIDDQGSHLLLKDSHSFRIYSEQEMLRLSKECRGFLLFLEQIRLLDSHTREIVITKALEIDNHHITLEDLKWIIMMVISNSGHSNEEDYAQIEELLYVKEVGRLH